jgi:type IV secretion system protein TrbJ
MRKLFEIAGDARIGAHASGRLYRRMSCTLTTKGRSRALGAVALLAAFATVAIPHAAHAQLSIPGMPQVVYDPSAVAKLVTQLSRQMQQITVARGQLQAQLDNMRKLANPPWRQINATMAQVDLLAQQGRSLAYSLRNIDSEFQRTFPGWQLSGTMATDMRTQNERTLATLRDALNATNATAQQFPIAAANINAMKNSMATITSAQQAAELNGAIGIQSAEELTLLRQQLAAQSNAQIVALADRINHELQGAAWQQAYAASAQVRPIAPPRRDINGWAF